VLGVVPVSWSRFLVLGMEVPTFLTAFGPRAKEARLVDADTSIHGTTDVSLEAVLSMVKRVAGGSVDADSPLMEAGLDSLGTVELRNQLQSVASGLVLPSTLVFEHPTARQLVAHVRCDDDERLFCKVKGAERIRPSSNSGLLPLVDADSFGQCVVTLKAGEQP